MTAPSRHRSAAVTAGLLLLCMCAGDTARGVDAITQASAGYTVTLEEVLISRTGERRVVSVETHGLRADGAAVLRLGLELTGRTIRLPSGRLVETNDLTRRMSTFVVGTGAVQNLRTPDASCRRGEEHFELVETVDELRAAKVAAADGAATRWYALDHSCALIRSVMQHEGGSRSEKRLVTLLPGPPDPALFDTTGYVEGPPSALEPNTPCDSSCVRRRERRDADYARLRPH